MSQGLPSDAGTPARAREPIHPRPPTPDPETTKMSLNAVIRKIPRSPNRGIQKYFRRFHADFANSSSPYRRPASTTPTLYPFSASRSALTDPPNPLPITSQS